MRRCPTCQRTYDESLKFCQADGTPLIDEANASPGGNFDSFGSSSDKQNDFAASDLDPMKTMVGAPPADLPPPSPFGDLGSTQPSSGDFAANNNRSSGNFGGSTSFQEPETQFGNNASFGQQPFGQPPAEWSAPPAPQSGWNDQGLGQNTPFSQPPIGSSGQSQGLAIGALVCGILSCLCCFSIFTGPAGLIMGYIARKNAIQQPNRYGGQNLALGGLITGAIGTLLGFSLIILQILGAFVR